ncbi:hypothetical protein [Granulicella sp. S156]|uniref:hypothetical protein n=1 Tax=Granulicella sp. S156 TaxID=1747224 RepID=UPI00131A6560|nr:hypothetical protein [Granulicella sp. S156]
MTNSSQHTPSRLRVLYRQFAFRIFELDSLSSKADVTKLLGQLSSVILMFSLIMMFAGFSFGGEKMASQLKQVFCWTMEYHLLSGTLLISGLCTLLGWDALLPDRKDVFVLGPLPIKPTTLCLAKTGASCSIVLISAFVLNCASGLIWPVVLAPSGLRATLQSYLAYWLMQAFAAIFLFASVLAIQSAAALLLPRNLFLRASAMLQVLLFATLLATFFLEPGAVVPEQLALQSAVAHVSWFPPYCFTAMFFQMQGTLPSSASTAAIHGWILLAGVIAASGIGSAALYANLLSRIAANADTVKTRFSPKRLPWLGGSLLGPLLLFSGRSLFRNRQQKLLLAFYIGIGSAILFVVFDMSSRAPLNSHISLQYLDSTIVMMTVVVLGLRVGFSFPVLLQANWVFRLHQVRIAPAYQNASRYTLIALTVLPVCIVSAVFGLFVEPAGSCCEHVLLLALYGILLADICLYGNRSIPYTCSYLPGTAQIPFLFWGSVVLSIPVVDAVTRKEQLMLTSTTETLVTSVILLLAAGILEWLNRTLAASEELRFDEIPEAAVITLGLTVG